MSDIPEPEYTLTKHPDGLETLKYTKPFTGYLCDAGYKYVFDAPGDDHARALFDHEESYFVAIGGSGLPIKLKQPTTLVHRMPL